jgi:hypothetical protein
MPHSKLLLSALAIVGGLLGSARSASAQFQLEVQSGSSTALVNNGANINVASNAVGQSQQVNVTVTYNGGGTATLNTPQLVGSSAFTLTSGSVVSLTAGQFAGYVITFAPNSAAQAFASLTIPFTQTSGASGSISLNFTGSAPSFTLGYAIQPQGNTVAVSTGGTLTFPPTVVGNSTTAILTIENTGSAAGVLNSLTLSGAAFQTKGLPLLPGTIGGGQALQVTIVYTPLAIGTDSGTLQLSLAGQTVNIAVTGSGVSSQLSFQFTEGTQTLPVNGTQVTLPDTQVGGTATVSVTATNNGNAAAAINAIALGGGGFQLVNLPPLPQTILPGGSIVFTFTFTPVQAGTFTGGLVIGGSTVTITARALGPLYQYSYTTGSSTSPISPNGSVFLATAQLGQSSSTTFTISNTGTAAGIISGIYIGEANSPYAITGLPPLPLTIAVNQSVSFAITFSPATVASTNGTLHLDGTAFVLIGAGGAPPALPAYSFTGPQGTLGALQQPAIGLNLAAPYPLPITGTLTMTVVPDGFTADPAIQFSSGGKSVAFTIPANTTAAVFAGGAASIKLQTGSTSGAITLTPAFQTASGVVLTPAAPQTLQLVVPATAPLLIGAQVTAANANGITLAISGVSNSQTLTQLAFSFTAAAGYTVSGASVTIPLSSVAAAWFESAAAQPFGGQFVATIPFTFSNGSSSSSSSSSGTVANLTIAVASVSITAANAQGTSAPLVVALP